MLVEFLEEVVEGFESYEYEEGGSCREDVESTSAGQTDGRCHPETGGCGQSANHILALMEDDGACADETDARYHLSGHARHVPAVFGGMHGSFEAVGRDDHKQGRA